jgi:hypothetical protein
MKAPLRVRNPEFFLARIELIAIVPSNLTEDFIVGEGCVDRECSFGIYRPLHEQERNALDRPEPIAFHGSAAKHKKVRLAGYGEPEIPAEIFLRGCLCDVPCPLEFEDNVLCDVITEAQRIHEVRADDCCVESVGLKRDYRPN